MPPFRRRRDRSRRRSRQGRSGAALLMSAALACGLTVGCTSTAAVPTTTSIGPAPSSSSAPAVTPTRSVSLPTSSALDGGPRTTASRPAGDARNPAPDVVRFQWLGKRPAAPGVQLAVPGGLTRWQGPLAGEYALISGSSRQWFGADGGMVGCVSDTKCLGVDAAGYLAAVQDGRTRLVYRPDGQPLGRFLSDGRRVAGPALPAMATAIAGTGVDLAGLVDRASRPVPFAGGITGDPHLLTAGGRRYSTQLTGQYQARTGDPGRAVQVRLEPLPHQPNVSMVTAAAIGGDGTVLEYTAQGAATLDQATLPAPSPFRQVSMSGGAVVGLWAADSAGTGHAAVVWPDGSSVVMSASADLGMTVVASAPHRDGVSGLFGVGSLDPANDLQDRQGGALDPDTVARDWLVRPKESMFGEQTDPIIGFPAALATVPGQALPFAEKTCRGAGLTNADDVTACIFDVGLTGDDGFVAGHAAMTAAARRQLPPQLAARFPGLELGPTGDATPLPELIDADFAVGRRQVYDLTTSGSGKIGFEFVSGCHDDEPAYPSGATAAVRLFDVTGQPVSQRFPACGQPESPALPAGRYYLVVAGPATGEPQQVRLQLHLP